MGANFGCVDIVVRVRSRYPEPIMPPAVLHRLFVPALIAGMLITGERVVQHT